jgi:riboflavin kinase/FMN adenylyltransferase
MDSSKYFSVLTEAKARLWVEPKALVLGNFDGVHLGHVALIRAGMEWAKSKGLPCVAVSFDPHPQQILAPPHTRLLPLEDQQKQFQLLGLRAVVYLPFSEQIRSLSPKDFLQERLAPLNPRGVFVGENFRFGKGRSAGVEALVEWGRPRGIEVFALASLEIDGEVISTSKIKSLLQEGRVEEVPKYLGRRYRIVGQVIPGAQTGRQLGYPTANLKLGSRFLPKSGVYAVIADILKIKEGSEFRREFFGVCHVGPKPTIDLDRTFVEVHLLDFTGDNDGYTDLYGQQLEIFFVSWIRGVKKFSTLEELKKQIAQDCDKAREMLGVLK